MTLLLYASWWFLKSISEDDWEIVTLNAIIFVRMTLLPVCCVLHWFLKVTLNAVIFVRMTLLPVCCVLHWFLKRVTEALGGTVRLIIIVFVCMMLLFTPCKVFHQFKGS